MTSYWHMTASHREGEVIRICKRAVLTGLIEFFLKGTLRVGEKYGEIREMSWGRQSRYIHTYETVKE